MALTGLPLVPMTETVTDDSQHQTDDDALASDDGAGGLAGILLMLPMLFLFWSDCVSPLTQSGVTLSAWRRSVTLHIGDQPRRRSVFTGTALRT